MTVAYGQVALHEIAVGFECLITQLGVRFEINFVKLHSFKHKSRPLHSHSNPQNQ